MIMNNVYFGNEGMTSTTANHYANIAKEMINSAFVIILGAIAVAFAISFGVGGREFAANMLKRIENKIDKK